MRKKIVAARDLPAGRRLEREDLALKSPGDGLPPYEIDRLIGLRLAVSLDEDDAVTFSHIEPADESAAIEQLETAPGFVV